MNQPIQALRGLAVVMVILYHSRLVFSGGFVGVDVFFVVSGFLIATSILRDIADNQDMTQIVRHFYIRRLTRLIPALVATTFVTVSVSFLVYSPYVEFPQVAQSALSSLLFVANGRFFLLNDYTSLVSDPFRHAWSLAVEEQFYLVFPIGVAALVSVFGRQDFRRRLFWFALVVGIVTFVLSALLSHGVRITPLPRRFGFYSPVSRAWQIGAGILLATVQEDVKSWITQTRLARSVIVLGFFVIIFSGVMLNEFDDYPGIRALIPVGGAVLVIVGGLVLSDWRPTFNRVLQHLGDISYSLYLVHWPLVVIGRRVFSDIEVVSIASIPVAYLLALTQYRFVERRFWKPTTKTLVDPSP